MTRIELLEQRTSADTHGQIAEPSGKASESNATSDDTAPAEALLNAEADPRNGRLAKADPVIPLADCKPDKSETPPSEKVDSTEPGRDKLSWRIRWRLSWRRVIVLAAVVLGIRTFIGEASVVPTASMEGTILVGDHLFMNKLLYGPEIPLLHWRLPMLKTIRRGEIVVFRYPKNPSETYLKRVAAVAGDRVEIRDGVLYINSGPVSEPYAVHHGPVHDPLESWGPTVVPPDSLFVMGDNRDNSSDSRDWGFVPVRNVIGEPLFVYWSYDAPTARWLDDNPAHRISFYASIVENFFSRTRWKRTGMLL
ncbi:MAG TPA: signal peptidase I [Candidatus Angelobacter sp.]|nr:signal peptidase I [Candidatus Angelobacter sp.]